MAKNILIFSDGTGEAGGATGRSVTQARESHVRIRVWKMALRLSPFRRRGSWKWTSLSAGKRRPGRAGPTSSNGTSGTTWRRTSILRPYRLSTAAFSIIVRSAKRSEPFRVGRRTEVDRRIVYIDPDPASPQSRAHDQDPGFFAALKGALSDIPRTAPVTDEISWVNSFNERARRLKAIVERARPQVSRLVANVMTESCDAITESQIREWREQANIRAAQDGGFAYEGYVGLKLASACAFISELIITIRGVRPGSPFARAIGEIVDAWAVLAAPLDRQSERGSFRGAATQGLQAAPEWVNLRLAQWRPVQGLGSAVRVDPGSRQAEATRRRGSTVRQGIGRGARSWPGRRRGGLCRST